MVYEICSLIITSSLFAWQYTTQRLSEAVSKCLFYLEIYQQNILSIYLLTQFHSSFLAYVATDLEARFESGPGSIGAPPYRDTLSFLSGWLIHCYLGKLRESKVWALEFHTGPEWRILTHHIFNYKVAEMSVESSFVCPQLYLCHKTDQVGNFPYFSYDPRVLLQPIISISFGSLELFDGEWGSTLRCLRKT